MTREQATAFLEGVAAWHDGRSPLSSEHSQQDTFEAFLSGWETAWAEATIDLDDIADGA